MRISTAQRNKLRNEGVSQGIKDISLMRGKFQDSYKENEGDKPIKATDTIESDDYGIGQTSKSALKDMLSRNNNGYHSMYHIKKSKNNKSQTISINRETRNTS